MPATRREAARAFGVVYGPSIVLDAAAAAAASRRRCARSAAIAGRGGR